MSTVNANLPTPSDFTAHTAAVNDEVKATLDYAINALGHIRNETIVSGVPGSPASDAQIVTLLNGVMDAVRLAHAQMRFES